jgi:hypothetical protein
MFGVKEALVLLGASVIGGAMGGGGQQTQTGSTASNIVGKQGMNLGESFLVSMGAMKAPKDMDAVSPFRAPEVGRARSLGEMRLGSTGSDRAMRLDPVQRMLESDPRVASAVTKMMTESTNPQMVDFRSKYATRATAQQGRRTLGTKQPGDIKVGV